MNQHDILLHLEKLVREQFRGEATGHDWHHIARVRDLALYLQKAEGGDRFIIHAAALLHDISDHKFNGGDALEGGRQAYSILRNLEADEQHARLVAAIVDRVSFKGAGANERPDSIEGQIVQDADRLDALGAIGIARAFAYGGYRGRPLYDPTIKPEMHDSFEAYQRAQSHTINHFYEKLLLLKNCLNTASARQLAEERHNFMERFLGQFYNEWYFTENE